MQKLGSVLMRIAILLVTLIHGSIAGKDGSQRKINCKGFPGDVRVSSEHQHLILDVDPGVDDAWALLLTFALNATVGAITCVNGNTDVTRACGNVLRILNVAGKSEVPVYRGCYGPLAGRYEPSDDYFGEDGFGNVSSRYPMGNEEKVNTSVHAALQMVSMARQNPKNYTLILLGPLTNAALALTLDTNFTKNLKAIFILGGNYLGRGNVLPGAEFNFQLDPEAADIVLSRAECPVTIVPWETAVTSVIPWDKYDELTKIDTKKGQFYKAVTAMHTTEEGRKLRDGALAGDALAVMAALVPGSVTKNITSRVAVELTGDYTRGQMVRGWEPYMLPHVTKKVTIAVGFNTSHVYKLFNAMLTC